jgi:hypothetical protein
LALPEGALRKRVRERGKYSVERAKFSISQGLVSKRVLILVDGSESGYV